MGRRRLAYTVRKFNDGFYVLLNVAAQGSLITEIERRLRVSEQVIKFITVRMDEEEKRLAKVKAIRDTKVKRSAQPIAAAAQAHGYARCNAARGRRREEAGCCSSGACCRDCRLRGLVSPSPERIRDDGYRPHRTTHHDRRTAASTRPHAGWMFRDSNAGLERRKAQRT